MLYTFTIRSKDRVYGETNDFRITLPYNAELARSDYWSIRVVRTVIPRTNFYPFWYTSATASTAPDDVQVSTSEHLEMQLDFGTPCHGYDTAIGGAGPVQHIVTNVLTDRDPNRAPLTLFESTPADAVEYRIVRPNLSELRVRLLDKFGRPARGALPASFPTYVANDNTTLLAAETNLPEWMLVVHIEAEKNILEY